MAGQRAGRTGRLFWLDMVSRGEVVEKKKEKGLALIAAAVGLLEANLEENVVDGLKRGSSSSQ